VKLHTLALPQLGTFLAMQNNGAITIAMIFQILKLHGIVENKGEGEWLRPLKETLGNSLYEQIMEAHEG
jgi:hypothetical protein